MSMSKGNELLQELYKRLQGRWYRQGEYAGQEFTCSDVQELIKRILKEYENDTN